MEKWEKLSFMIFLNARQKALRLMEHRAAASFKEISLPGSLRIFFKIGRTGSSLPLETDLAAVEMYFELIRNIIS